MDDVVYVEKGCVQSFQAIYVAGKSLKCAILWFYRVEDHLNL